MPRTNPKILLVTEYLRKQFPLQEDLDLSREFDSSKSKVFFTYNEVKEALIRLKVVDPGLHNIMAYLWQSNRRRSTIAEVKMYDPSTIRRRWITATLTLLNYLINEEACADLEPLDIYMMEAKAGNYHRNL